MPSTYINNIVNERDSKVDFGPNLVQIMTIYTNANGALFFSHTDFPRYPINLPT